MTLADEDTNSILTDNAKRAIQGNEAMQAMHKFATNVSGAMLLPSLIQVTESISGSVVPLAMFFLLAHLQNCATSTLKYVSKPSSQRIVLPGTAHHLRYNHRCPYHRS